MYRAQDGRKIWTDSDIEVLRFLDFEQEFRILAFSEKRIFYIDYNLVYLDNVIVL